MEAPQGDKVVSVSCQIVDVVLPKIEAPKAERIKTAKIILPIPPVVFIRVENTWSIDRHLGLVKKLGFVFG
jgi:hypothetical protein